MIGYRDYAEIAARIPEYNCIEDEELVHIKDALAGRWDIIAKVMVERSNSDSDPTWDGLTEIVSAKSNTDEKIYTGRIAARLLKTVQREMDQHWAGSYFPYPIIDTTEVKDVHSA